MCIFFSVGFNQICRTSLALWCVFFPVFLCLHSSLTNEAFKLASSQLVAAHLFICRTSRACEEWAMCERNCRLSSVKLKFFLTEMWCFVRCLRLSQYKWCLLREVGRKWAGGGEERISSFFKDILSCLLLCIISPSLISTIICVHAENVFYAPH